MAGAWATSLNSISRLWGDWMISMSVQVALLVALLCLIDTLLRRFSARLRFAIWLIVLLRLVTPPSFAAPTGITWWFSDWISSGARAVSTVTTLQWNSSSIDAEVIATPTRDAIHVAADASQSNVTVWFLLWLGIVVAQLSWFLAGWFQIRIWLQNSAEIDQPQMLSLLKSAQQRVGIHRPIGLRDCGRCTTPLVLGGIRPIILLPTALRESLTERELESVLVHELTHVRRGDGWLCLVQTILMTLYFFHPAVWMAVRTLRRRCEEACDEQTIVALAGQRKCYAEAIFKAATFVGYQPPNLALHMLGHSYPVKRRLQRILDPHLVLHSGGGWWRGAMVTGLALLLLPAGVRANPSGAKREPAWQAIEVMARADAQPPAAAGAAQAVEAAPTAVNEAEAAALRQLASAEFEERMAAYAQLERVGSIRSLTALESAFLSRTGIEQDAAQRALDKIWRQIRTTTLELETTSLQHREFQEK